MKARRYLGSALLLLLAACTLVFADDVKTDRDKDVDFSKFKTYSWIKVHANNDIWQHRIVDAVDNALQTRGLQKVESGGDLGVAAVGSTRNQQEYQTFYDGLGGWRWGGFGDTATTTVQNYPIGSLVVDLFDGTSKQLVWRGSSSASLSNDPNKNEKKLEHDVDKMFEKYPH